MISYKQALQILKKSSITIKDETINSKNAVNRVLSSNIVTPAQYPSANNAAFDGFAIRSKDTKGLGKNNPKKFKIIGCIASGDKPLTKKINAFEAAEIMTGAILPKTFDTIIPVEQIKFEQGKKDKKYIIINRNIKKNLHIRYQGSDYKKNDLIIKKGTIIQPNHILALETLGIQKIKVKKKPNILFFSTGNEISNNKIIPTWKIRNSNSKYINALDYNFLFNFQNGGIVKDHQEQYLFNRIKKILKSNIDIIITTGAVSAGKFDFVPSAIKKFTLSNFFNGVSIRPGKPILFARIKNSPKAIFGLPGNPISSAACFRFFIQPFIMQILGVSDELPLKAILKKQFHKKKDITRFVKSKLTSSRNGKLELEVLQKQESFRIRSFIHSNIWAVFPSGKSDFKKGDIIDCYIPHLSNKNIN